MKDPVDKLFEAEKSLMIPVNTIYFDTARYETRKVNKYGLIKFSNCRYSASPKYVGENVTLRIMANEIENYHENSQKQNQLYFLLSYSWLQFLIGMLGTSM